MRRRAKRAGAWWPYSHSERMGLLGMGVQRVSVNRHMNPSEFELWVRKTPGEGNGNLLQYSCLENSMDRRATGWLESMWSQRSRHD